ESGELEVHARPPVERQRRATHLRNDEGCSVELLEHELLAEGRRRAAPLDEPVASAERRKQQKLLRRRDPRNSAGRRGCWAAADEIGERLRKHAPRLRVRGGLDLELPGMPRTLRLELLRSPAELSLQLLDPGPRLRSLALRLLERDPRLGVLRMFPLQLLDPRLRLRRLAACLLQCLSR